MNIVALTDRIYSRLEHVKEINGIIYATVVINEITTAGKDRELHTEEVIIYGEVQR
jgi:hypothetical protein